MEVSKQSRKGKPQAKILRALICITLALAMAITMAPISRISAYADSGTDSELSKANAIFEMDKQEPEGMDEYPDSVYDSVGDTPFNLLKQDEIAVIMNSGGSAQMYRFDNINFDLVDQNAQYDHAATGGVNAVNAENMSVLDSQYMDKYQEMDCMQSIGLDWDGTGRKEYIASVGYVDDGKNIVMSKRIEVTVQNARTGECVIDTDWLINTMGIESAPYWMKDNWIDITAGDYDGDGRDSVVIACSGHNSLLSSPGPLAVLWEFYPSDSNEWGGNSSGNFGYRILLDFKDVLKSTPYIDDITDYRYRPTISLATGDFNGDGRDQLAYMAGYYNTGDNVMGGYMDYETNDLEQFAACAGIMDCTDQGDWSGTDPMYMYDMADKPFETVNGESHYPVNFLHVGSIAAGDVNNDGIDEIVAAGYMSTSSEQDPNYYARAVYKNGKLQRVKYVYDYSPVQFNSSVISYSKGSYVRSKLISFDMLPELSATFKKNCNDYHWAFTSIAIACGKTKGDNEREDVFIAGGVYDFSDFTPKRLFAPSDLITTGFFSNISGESGYTAGSEEHPWPESQINWIRSVAVGNFDGNPAGREQFVFTTWQKYYTGELYVSNLHTISCSFSDGEDYFGTEAVYAQGGVYEDSYQRYIYENKPFTDYAHAWSQIIDSQMQFNVTPDMPLYAIPVAVDVDGDGILGRFSNKGYVYTDPEVLAVLEAAPYFEDVDEAGGYDGSCSTRYSISTGYRSGSTRTDNYGFEVGLSGELAVTGARFALEAGLAIDWSKSIEEAYTLTSTYTCEALKQDTVVLSRIPILIYTYDIWDEENQEWIVNGYNVKVPMPACYSLLTVKEYNKFVEEYNKRIGEGEYKLLPIEDGEDLPANHLGNPKAYLNAMTGYTKLSKNDVEMSKSSSQVSFEYSTSAEKTESSEISHGVHFGLTVQGGGQYGFGEAWAGAYANVDYSQSTVKSVTKVDTNTSGCTVPNINADNLIKAGYNEADVNMYSFFWQFGKWTRNLQSNGTAVPFYGYLVRDLNEPKGGLVLDWNNSKNKDKVKITMPYKETNWTGKAIKPTPKVKFDGKTLKSGTDFTVTYSNNKNVGKATATIKGKGKYSGSIKKTFTINPKGTTLSSLTAASKAITVKWKKQSTKMSSSRITGYEIQLATNSAFTKNKKTVTVSGYSKVSKKVTGLKGGKKYYVRIRTYKTVSGVKYYSKWSAKKSITTKK